MKLRNIRGLAAIAMGVLLSTAAYAENATVSVTAIVEHPSLDAVREGVKSALEKAGYIDGKNLKFTFDSAQGTPAIAAQIAQRLAGEEPNVIVPISTPSAQAVVSATQEVPVVFTAVTDPVGARLVSGFEATGTNVTGVSDFAPIKDQVNLAVEILPNLKRLGVLYNPGEPNSLSVLARLKEVAAKNGIELVEGPATKSSDVQAAAQSLVGRVDAMYIPTDNTIVSALESVVNVGVENKLPIFGSETDSVKRGALAAVGFDYFQVGIETGNIVAQILGGKRPGEIPVVNATGSSLAINIAIAEKIGLSIPESVIKRADTVIK